MAILADYLSHRPGRIVALKPIGDDDYALAIEDVHDRRVHVGRTPRDFEPWLRSIKEGRRFRIAQEEISARVGDIVVAAAGVPHMGWNAGDDEVYVKVRMRPALRWEDFMIKLFEMAGSGRTDESGILNHP